jgi:NTE family protein
LRLRLTERNQLTRIDPWGQERPVSSKRPSEDHEGTTPGPILTDGGVYDNLGVEPVWGRYSLLVSDAGRPFASVSRSGQFLTTRLQRAISISLEQVSAVRKRWLVSELASGRQRGALWATNSLLEDFSLADAQGYGPPVRPLLQGIRTDLNSFSEGEIACLENHGYSLADAAIRSRAPELCPNLSVRFVWPHDNWRDEARVHRALARSSRISLLRDISRLVIRLGRP